MHQRHAQRRPSPFLSNLLPLALLVAFSSACSQIDQGKVDLDDTPVTPAAGTGNFLVLSDIHFDPFTGYDSQTVTALDNQPASNWGTILAGSQVKTLCELTKSGGTTVCEDRHDQDTNYPLLKSSLEAAAAQLVANRQKADYVLITGDFLGHHFPSNYSTQFPGKSFDDYTAFVKKTMEFLNLELSAAFPSVPIFPALGNNDAYCGDYGVSGQSGFLGDLAAIWQPLVGQPLAGFSQSGSYKVSHPVVKNLDFVMFNNVPLSKNYTGSSTTGCTKDLTSVENAWLSTTLANAKGKVVLAYHIPPGVDQYGTAKDNSPISCANLTTDFDLSTAEEASFARTVAGSRDKIHSVFAAHTHQDDFRLFQLADPVSTLALEPLAIRVNPSISIHNGNNPGFQIFTYATSDGALLDYTTYYLSNIDVAGTMATHGHTVAADWPELYRFSTDYFPGTPAKSFSVDSVNQLIGHLTADPSFAQNTYWQWHALEAPVTGAGAVSTTNWPIYRCSLSNLTELGFENCVCPSS